MRPRRCQAPFVSGPAGSAWSYTCCSCHPHGCGGPPPLPLYVMWRWTRASLFVFAVLVWRVEWGNWKNAGASRVFCATWWIHQTGSPRCCCCLSSLWFFTQFGCNWKLLTYRFDLKFLFVILFPATKMNPTSVVLPGKNFTTNGWQQFCSISRITRVSWMIPSWFLCWETKQKLIPGGMVLKIKFCLRTQEQIPLHLMGRGFGFAKCTTCLSQSTLTSAALTWQLHHPLRWIRVLWNVIGTICLQ